MRSIVRSSRAGSVSAAVSEAVGSESAPLGIIFLSDYARLTDISKALRDRFPDTQIIGTAGTVYHGSQIDDNSILIVTMITGDASLSAGVITNLSKCPLGDMYKLSESVRAVSPKRDDTVCIEFCTTNEEVLVSSMNVVLKPNNVSLAGGTVFGAPEGQPSLVSYNGTICQDACVYMVIKNLTGNAYVLRENIYDRAGGPAHIATKVNLSKKEVTELDHRPAADVYAAETGVARNNIVNNVMQAPFGRVVDQDIYISSMNGVDAHGGITNYKKINQNDALYILKLLDYRAINDQTRKQISQKIARPSLIFSVNCIYRYLLFKDQGYLTDFLTGMSKLGPFVGYIGGGEQFNRQHVNQTMVCAVFD